MRVCDTVCTAWSATKSPHFADQLTEASNQRTSPQRGQVPSENQQVVLAAQERGAQGIMNVAEAGSRKRRRKPVSTAQ